MYYLLCSIYHVLLSTTTNLFHSVIVYLLPILRLQLLQIGLRLSISRVPPLDSGKS